MGSVYATAPIVDGHTAFEVGDELHLHFTPEALDALIARGDASREPPGDLRPAYALTNLSYHPHAAGHHFRRGDRIDGKMPAKLVRTCVERGDASYDRPADVQPIYALEPISHSEHSIRLDFAAGERIDGKAPENIVAGWLDSGHASYDEPETS